MNNIIYDGTGEIADGSERMLKYNAETFAVEVENRIAPGAGYIETTADLLAELDLDAEDAMHLISPTLKQRIQAEAVKRGMTTERNNTTDLTGFMGT